MGRPHSAVRFERATPSTGPGRFEDHSSGTPTRNKTRIDIKERIFQHYFDADLYAGRAPSPVLSRPPRVHPAPGGATPRTPPRRTPVSAPTTPFAALLVPASPPPEGPWSGKGPSRTGGRRPSSSRAAEAGAGPASPPSGDSPVYVATRPITHGGSLGGHVDALHALLSKSWSRQEVQQLHSWGFFRRLCCQLAVASLQRPAALLLATCASVWPPSLEPHAHEVVTALPVVLASSAPGVRPAGMQLLFPSSLVHAPSPLATTCARLMRNTSGLA